MCHPWNIRGAACRRPADRHRRRPAGDEPGRPRHTCLLVHSALLLRTFDGGFSVRILVFSALTTIFLQILSNLANDYGDSIHGADSDDRKGPQRAVQSGTIGAKEMKTAIGIVSNR